MSKREKGAVTLACPECGNELAAEEQPDGSLAAGSCDKHKTKTEKATTTPRRETGTDVEENS